MEDENQAEHKAAKAHGGRGGETIEIPAGGRAVPVSRPGKVLFPEDGITKRDLAEYYAAVAELMVPYLTGRPIAMERFPDGLGGQRFYQKKLPSSAPEWVHRAVVSKKGGELTQAIGADAATLVWLADQACITPHIWLSRIDEPMNPDLLIFDLDPPGYDAFGEAQRVALAVRDLLSDLTLSCVAKTTGGKGIHVVVPLDRSADYGAVRAFADTAGQVLAGRDPERLTTEFRKEQRQGRLFMDTTRNAYAQHVVAPYAVRARPGAPVATPLTWEEVEDRRLRPEHFTLRSVPERVARGEPAWPALTGQSLRGPANLLAALASAEAG
ncbi:MAG TPA: non-homologous end-joining DNA ligase [Actinomycetota bacterium]|nr:non-homologous end-joining DNA ligase [Actinomycetota bacterium]